MAGKAHEVGMEGGSIGAEPVCLALTVMPSKEETDWEHFRYFGDILGC